MSQKEKKRPNWLLRGLIAVSVGFHVVLLGYIAGVCNTPAASTIELTVQPKAEPARRSIPRPPQRFKTSPCRDTSIAKPACPAPVQTACAAPAPAVRPVPSTMAEPIAAPDRPAVSAPGAVAWPMPPPASGDTSACGSPGDYFSMVRMRIESQKRYPEAARKRGVEGRVKVRFVIETDGSVSALTVAEKSRNRMLDEAALEAVRASSPFPPPPARFAGGPLALEVSIVFDLM